MLTRCETGPGMITVPSVGNFVDLYILSSMDPRVCDSYWH